MLGLRFLSCDTFKVMLTKKGKYDLFFTVLLD